MTELNIGERRKRQLEESVDVHFKNIRKSFGDVEVLKGIDLSIRRGEFFSLLGPSGCGKTTLLRILAGFEFQDSGEVLLRGAEVSKLPPNQRSVNTVFQNYALFPHMTVFDNVAFGLRMRKVPASQLKDRVVKALETVEIGQFAARKPMQLSGGQRQRVALGRAIVREPKVFLMDEPLSNLDAKLRVEMRSQISKLHQRLKATTIYVTHDQIEAMTMGTRIVVMKDGFIQQVDTPLNLYDYPKNKFVAGFIGSPSMNFLTGTVKGDMVTGDGFAVQATGALGESLKAHNGKQVWFGIRPEHLGLEGSTTIAGGNNRLSGKIEVVEPLGAETDLVVDINGQTVVVKVDGHARVKVGDTVNLFADQSRLHAFDLQSELAIGR